MGREPSRSRRGHGVARIVTCGLLGGWLALASTFGAPAPAGAFAPAYEAPRLFPSNWPDLDDVAPLPMVLSDGDVQRYRTIFALQEQSQWAAADRLMAALDDRLLVGHLLHQRYMHPTGWRSSYAELSTWLANHPDHPGAQEIWRLANARAPKGAKGLPKPPAVPSGIGLADEEAELPYRKQATAKAETAAARALAQKVETLLRQGERAAALRLLHAEHRRLHLPSVDHDLISVRIAASFFFAGEDAEALNVAAAASRSRQDVPAADWLAGMAAFRQGEVGTAALHFEALANSEAASSWSRAAGAFWGARAHLIGKRPQKVTALLELAAAQPRTFYGILANRLLGRDADLHWRAPPLKVEEMARLMLLPAVRRAIALQAVGEAGRADMELRQAFTDGGSALGPALLGLASRLGMPQTQVRLAQAVPGDDGRIFAAAMYPLPPWEPEGGFSIDRALLYALIRQESGFNVAARSTAGARGLMQIMPATANFLAGGTASKTKLMSPEYNMALGQKYLRLLLDHDDVKGNLVLLAVAYNAGPGNLKKWLKQMGPVGDPLLFIESLPSQETRNFVIRVLTNYWLYRIRFEQAAPSLEVLAEGNWPYYVDVDDQTESWRYAGK